MGQATSVFNAIDTNYDGKISRAEFSNYVMGTTTTSNVVAPQANYYNMPSYNVVQPAVSNYVKPAAQIATYVQQPAVSSVFNTIDTNHDGKISRAEFSNYVMGTTAAAPVATYVQPAANSYYVQPQ